VIAVYNKEHITVTSKYPLDKCAVIEQNRATFICALETGNIQKIRPMLNDKDFFLFPAQAIEIEYGISTECRIFIQAMEYDGNTPQPWFQCSIQ
jgi:hypothetical protein